MKKVIGITIGIILLGTIGFYWMVESTNAKLVEPIKIKEEFEEFIVHIRVENIDEGIKILRSLEYRGEEPVTIEHRTPLTSVDISKNNNDFTGSFVTKNLNAGDIYRPQEPKVYESPSKGKYTLHMHTQFFIDGEPINITSEEEVVFE
ncbi:hypothetical protein NC661_09840 [Aquibacillus koreensis]|uniref:Uncharacterized protein n=1 Tax=Aquibacillus koreensis TaxID=279446 RepID=A0A9X4AIE9_9BACI|nr:hypothetical protein [Aquibacillus koreensis]MCT2534348.1 hypothetical protein [Aquibacillus koreensis]MDC3420669.1 hypothetical protein [Aquibacillus koreensis]